MTSGPERNPRDIARVVIVGGGTAGWMAALYLHRNLRHRGVEITLVESPIVGTIGVGEATIPSMVEFVRKAGLDEAEFMRRCSATFKLAIKFVDWRGPGTDYWHAFGLCGGQINGLDLFHFWRKHREKAGAAYSDFSLHARLCERGKAAQHFGEGDSISQFGSYAYHLDAGALAEYLREVATAGGVKHYFGHVESVALDAAGQIASLDIGGERIIAGDLFLDATGFHGRLMERELGDPWIDWSNQLLCDGAVAIPLPRDATFPPYTLSTAAPAGWMWRIPLQSRVGAGYVFSRAHLSDDEAAATLIARSGLGAKRAADPRAVKIKVGRRTSTWVKNCVAIGLCSGFVEPLESTGIHIIFKAVKLLLEYWPDRDFAPAPIAAFNDEMTSLYDEVRDFIMLHYALADRNEPFWRDAIEAARSPGLVERIALYDDAGRVRLGPRPVFYEPNYHFVFAGNGRVPARGPLEVDAARPDDTLRVLAQIRVQNDAFAREAPTHADILARLGRAAA